MWTRRKPKLKRALVLGCGPAGLFAAHALRSMGGWEVNIWSKKRISPMYGAQYLHGPVPGLTEDDPIKVNVILNGSWEESTRKVYGPTAKPSITFEQYLETRGYAWDIRAAYLAAWLRYEGLVENLSFDGEKLYLYLENPFLNDWQLVVNSVPRNKLCLRPDAHTFRSQDFWASGDAPDRGIYCPISCPPRSVVINGTQDRAWYRISNIHGHTTAEWPLDRKPPIENVSMVTRPLGHNCDCWPGMLHVGRYGSWQPGYLSHSAYSDTLAAARALA